jgi:hypothetical protein
MKLYTEEQVRQMLEVCILSDKYPDVLTLNDVLKTQTPIELSSDENVHLEARRYEDYSEYMDVLQSEKALSRYNGFIRGVDWMRDKIQGAKK